MIPVWLRFVFTLPLITSGCAKAGCHDLTAHQNDVVLTDYTNIITTGEIKPGDPEESKLYKKIVDTDPDERMPPPPESPLPTAKIAAIGKWIQQGATAAALLPVDWIFPPITE